jgi:IstB-like ATP binding protein
VNGSTTMERCFASAGIFVAMLEGRFALRDHHAPPATTTRSATSAAANAGERCKRRAFGAAAGTVAPCGAGGIAGTSALAAAIAGGVTAYVPLSQTGAELLFEIFSQRYERGSTIVTSNLPFDEWTSVFGSERLTGALLDRLTHHVHILEMNGNSYRLNQSKRRSRRNNADPSPDDPTPA